jgi:Tfp pilus assembly protein PilN
MMVLGVTLAGDGLRAVVAERMRHAIEIVSYHEREIASASPSAEEVRVALHDLIDETRVRDVAMILNVPDVLITRIPNQERLHGRERHQAARLLVESYGFGPAAPFKMPQTRDSSTYIAVARQDRVDTLDRIVREAGGRLAWLDHEAYAWASILPENAQALLVANNAGARLIIAGAETVEIGTYLPADFASGIALGESTEAKISGAILEEIVSAAKANFADVDMIAIDDPAGHYKSALAAILPSSIGIEPFSFDLSPEHTEWALACGVALRALQPGHDRLHVNFTEPHTPLTAATNRLARFVGSGDFVALAAGVALAIGLISWRSETVHELQRKAVLLEQQVIQARQEAAFIDQKLATVATARAVLDRVESAQRSGPLTARQIAVIVDRINLQLTASTLGSTGGSWALSGHALDASDVAGLMTQMQSTGYDSSLTSTEQEGPRLAYAIELDPPAPVALPSPGVRPALPVPGSQVTP